MSYLVKSRAPNGASECPLCEWRRIEAVQVDSGNINLSADRPIWIDDSRAPRRNEGWSDGPPRRFGSGVDLHVCKLRDVGAIGQDMVNFGPMNTVPDKFKRRKFYEHNANVTLMRTTVDESRELGEGIGRKAGAATGPTCIMIPLKVVSAVDQCGKAFDDPAARAGLIAGIRMTHNCVELLEIEAHTSDVEFAEAAAQKLLKLIRSC